MTAENRAMFGEYYKLYSRFETVPEEVFTSEEHDTLYWRALMEAVTEFSGRYPKSPTVTRLLLALIAAREDDYKAMQNERARGGKPKYDTETEGDLSEYGEGA